MNADRYKNLNTNLMKKKLRKLQQKGSAKRNKSIEIESTPAVKEKTLLEKLKPIGNIALTIYRAVNFIRSAHLIWEFITKL